MGLFDFFKSEPTDPWELFKAATAKSNNGEYEEAIAIHKKAVSLVEADPEDELSVEYYLRLPRYLQAAGRNDEAWGEYNRLLVEYRTFSETLPMMHSKIYNSMKIHLHQIGKHALAARFAAISYFHWIYGLYQQKRFDELKIDTATEAVAKKIRPSLRKAKRIDVLDQVVAAFQECVQKLPKANLGDMSRKIDKVIAGKD